MLQLKGIVKEYPLGEGTVVALDRVSLDFRTSEFVAVLGPSGCGKTTLLNIVGGLDSYTKGDLIIDGTSTVEYRDSDWDNYRNQSVGFVFQSYNLISHQTALSNVEMALKISGEPKTVRREKAIEALKKVGLGDQLYKKSALMSGGQMQRVAIARALVNNPEIILADEPTGALDSETGIQIMELLKQVAKDRLVIMVTHNPDLAAEYATRIIHLKDGRVTQDTNPVRKDELAAKKPAPARRRAELGFITALGLSANNLMTKKGRSLLAAFAGAIGIIGIALILALSNGMNDYISGIESDTMGSYPVELEKETYDYASFMDSGGGLGMAMSAALENTQKEEDQEREGIFSRNIVAESVMSSSSLLIQNNLGSFKDYLEAYKSGIEDSISAIEYGYDVEPQVFRIDERREGETGQSASIIRVSPAALQDESTAFSGFDGGFEMGGNPMGGSSGSVSSRWSQIVDNQELREKQYELIEGTWPTAFDEIALVIDANNEITDYTLYMLGLMDIEHMDEIVTAIENDEAYEDPQENFSYQDALGLEFKAFSKSELYAESSSQKGVWIDKSEDEGFLRTLYDEGATLRITAILRSTDDADVSSGMVYTGALTLLLMNTIAHDEAVLQQLAHPETNILTGEPFDEPDNENDAIEQYRFDDTGEMAAGEGGMPVLTDDQIALLLAQASSATPSSFEEVLTALGYVTEDQPSSILIYPTDFEGKASIKRFIKAYNEQVSDDADRVAYTDLVGLMTSSITQIVTIISYILIAFVAISLIVSSIMIAIITYISVLERTKEIGILRALGASKNDVSKIFNAETVIEGLVSGVLGVGTALLISIPLNAIIASMFGAENIASLPLVYVLALIAISVVLTLFAGFVPSRLAARKDPVEALRSE